MTIPIDPKSIPMRLDPASYEVLRQQVLRRDGWRCQGCGTMSNLEVHHKQFRSRSGDDSEENLITLCVPCHREIHQLAKRKWNIVAAKIPDRTILP
jgi:5-methylcytosine-specific restriction endonuclease McrA